MRERVLAALARRLAEQAGARPQWRRVVRYAARLDAICLTWLSVVRKGQPAARAEKRGVGACYAPA